MDAGEHKGTRDLERRDEVGAAAGIVALAMVAQYAMVVAMVALVAAAAGVPMGDMAQHLMTTVSQALSR